MQEVDSVTSLKDLQLNLPLHVTFSRMMSLFAISTVYYTLYTSVQVKTAYE